MKLLVTGGSGFIGSNLIRLIISETNHKVLNLDKLTYASNSNNLYSISENQRYQFQKGDIGDKSLVKDIFQNFKPDRVINLAAESHVDNSIKNPNNFIQTNIMGTYNLLETSREYWENKSRGIKDFYIHHVSTDEVFGSMEDNNLFTEESPYKPNSPYSASKASSDHLVRAWNKTYGLPTIISNCSNNYGPYQFPEKLIPLTISCCLKGAKIPIYGNGLQIRDWLFVEDHSRALLKIISKGKIGNTYNIGSNSERNNLQVVNAICEILDQSIQNKPKQLTSFKKLICFVDDRPGHDKRYGIDASKIRKELEWEPKISFENGLEFTVDWYLKNRDWLESSDFIN